MNSRQSFLLAIILAVATCSYAKDVAKNLSPHYREWLTKDVAYIITNEEKQAFLQLTSDEARDRFIDRFWEVRNPTPGSPTNPYKAEHYRRLEYANEYFGHISHTEGWRTDMGRIYITLGEPSQRQKLLGLQKITPMEIWFYSNASPALPPFFYVVFYQRDQGDEFRLYSPYSDGPERLITAVVGPTRQNALYLISQDAGRDVARVTLSLIPDEPVDFNSGTISLQSDVMLNTIRNLANNPLYKEEIQHRRRLLEDVTHRLIMGDEFLDVLTVPLRDHDGNFNLHYVLRLRKPEDFTVAESTKGGYYYSILASADVRSADGKLIYRDEHKIARDLAQSQLDDVKGKVFSFEGLLPLTPGKYKISFELVNELTKTGFHREVQVEVPSPGASPLEVSNIVPFSSAKMTDPRKEAASPFTGAGVSFVPLTGPETALTQGQPVKFFYQVWAPSKLGGVHPDKKLEVTYVYGRMGDHESNQTIHDEIPLNQLDSGGSIINGKQIPTADLPQGNYRLAMTVRDPETGSKGFGSLTFSVSTVSSATPSWDVTAPDAEPGKQEFQRATCYVANGDMSRATQWLQMAYTRNPSNERFRERLIQAYYQQKQYAEVVKVYSRTGLDDGTDEHTILSIADSFAKTGDLKKALATMEAATNLKPSSGPLLLGLAEYYRQAGDMQKAAAAEQRGRQLMSAAPAS
jgi:GWxTD domain-containing protein